MGLPSTSYIRTAIEEKICTECVHEFGKHPDCERCATDHTAWQAQMEAKTLPIFYHGIALGDVYSKTRRQA